jgi:hypothetical protein
MNFMGVFSLFSEESTEYKQSIVYAKYVNRDAKGRTSRSCGVTELSATYYHWLKESLIHGLQ